MICPSCQQDVSVTEANHGALYTCDQCQAVYFINFDGQPEYEDVPSEMPPESLESLDLSGGVTPDTPPEASEPELQSEPESESEPEPFSASFEPLVDSINVVSVDPALDGSIGSEVLGDFNNNFEDGIGDSPSEEIPTSENVFESPSPEFESVVEAVPGLNAFASVAKEISDFGNTEVQLAGLNYNLKISGLDTQETMRLFKEAIEDSKFGWDPSEILKNIKNGQVEFTRLSPVKAYILAKRLRFLDIEKKWEQHVLS